ncbi:MAG: hypothetical protein NTX57_09130, partial [Armatimonadetes bacterium]|nr:hypothetical protein [Armatimonadota bacterium]
LLPLSYTLAKERVELLRQAQYVPVGAPRPEGIPLLLGGHVRFIATMLVSKPGGAPPEKSALAKLFPFAAQSLLSFIRLSPGLAEALGLEKEGGRQLTEFAHREGL